jgi:uncharacterized protein YukE
MSIKDKDIGADLSLLEDLNERQRSYVGRFQEIMLDLEQQASTLLSEWEGAGTEEHTAKVQEFDVRFQQVISAFQRMVDASDGAVDNYRQLTQYFRNIFS